MKNRIAVSFLSFLAGGAMMLAAPLAGAQQVNWSVTVGTPYAQPVYTPAPVYVPPQRVYVAPQPVYVQSYAAPVAVVQYRNYPQPYYYVEEPRRHGHHGHGHGHGHGHHGYRD